MTNSMKKSARLSVWMLAILMVFSVLFIHIGAEETDPIYENNITLLAEKFSKLQDIQNANILTPPVGSEANTYVVKYINKLNEIGKNVSLLKEESTADLIELYYMQGVASNRIALIYYSYINQFEGEAKNAIDRVHNGVHTAMQEIDGLQDEIAYAANADDLNEKLGLSYNNGGLCARMYVAIYRQKLLALLEDGDSDVVKAIVTGEDGALIAITKCSDVTTSVQYEKIYLKAQKEVLIQRYRDQAKEELTESYQSVYPEGLAQEDETVLSAIVSINATELYKEMNAVLQAAAEKWISGFEADKPFVTLYLNGLREAVSEEIARANQEEVAEIADLSLVFEGFTLKLARADAKDMISADVAARDYAEDEEMQALLESYIREDAILDGCGSVEEIAFEVERAKLCADLYGEYVKVAEFIETLAGENALLEDAYEEYEYALFKITKVDRTKEGALEDCVSEFEKAVKVLEEYAADAEVLAYESKHADILKKEAYDVTEADKDAILSAIEDMSGLSDGAKAIFAEKRTPDALADKYKTVTELEIEKILGTSSPIRKDHFYAVKEQLDDLHVSSDQDKLADLVATADNLVEKSAKIDKVLDRYEEILTSDTYGDFPDANRTELEKLAKDSTESIRDAEGDVDKAITELDRAEACGKIDSFVEKQSADMNEETKSAVQEIADNAKKQIGGSSDPARLDRIVETALFGMEKELDVQAAGEKSDTALDAVDKLEMLTDEEKASYKKQIADSLAKHTRSIRSAADDAARDSAVAAFDKSLNALIKQAEAADESERTNAKAAATDKLTELQAQLNEKIDKLFYLSEDEKNALKQETTFAVSQGVEAIDSASNSEEIASAEKEADYSLNAIIEKAFVANKTAEDAQKNQLNADIRSKAGALISKIDGATYLSEKEKSSLKQQVENVVVDFATALSTAKSREDLTAVAENSNKALEGIESEFDAQEIGLAQSATLKKINDEEKTLNDLIDSFRFLDEYERAELKKLGADTAARGRADVESATSVDEVHIGGEKAIAALQEQKTAAEDAEDEACVRTLTPFMTGLAIACGVEAVVLLALWLTYRKKSSLSCFVPVMALAMMPTPLAWTLTVLLSVADVVLAVLIVYFAIKLLKMRKKKPVFFPEDVDESAEEQETDNTPIPTTATAPEPKRFGLKARVRRLGLLAPLQRPRLTPKPQLIYLMPPTIPQLLDSVSADEADLLISDEDAFHCEETNIVNSEVYSGRRKASINIDVIGASFSKGDVVSLNTLKEKKLISEKVGHIKILGRGRLDKPLTVIAQNFSASAVKMIVLTGGSAILAEGAPKRRK